MASLEMIVNQGRNPGQRQCGLRDVVAGVGLDLGGELARAASAVECGPTNMPYPPALVGALYHELLEILQNVLAFLLPPAQEGRYVRENRIFAFVVADHVGDVGVDDFVVGDAVAGSVGQRHVPGAIGIHQARHAEEGIRAE